MICDTPIRIRNQYTGKYMFVPCRHCASCLIEKANIMSMNLSNYMEQFTYSYLITLTYDNYHLPVIVTGRSGIYRLLDDTGEIGDLPFLVSDTEETFDFDGANYTPTNYPIQYGCCGVLYYPDVQKFFKRFRINYLRDYGKKANFKFYLCGEYGGNMRPHYHIIILSDSARFEEIRNLVVKSWTLCDWCKLDLDKSIEQTNLGGVAGYVSSYVNCLSNCDELFQQKSIKPFTHRSKDLNFGADRGLEDEIIQYVEREDNSGFSEPYRKFFQRFDTRQISVPLVTLSSKFLFSYFSKPRGFSYLSVNSQCRRLAEVLRTYLFNKKIKNLGISSLSKYLFSNSSDYKAFLSYRRFCLLFHLNPFLDGSIEVYISAFIDVHSYYSSIKLRDFMNTIKTRGFVNYLLDCNQSYADDLEKRSYRMTWKTGLHNVCFHDWFESSFSRNKRLSYRQRYAKKLLPKHINEYFGNFNVSYYV